MATCIETGYVMAAACGTAALLHSHKVMGKGKDQCKDQIMGNFGCKFYLHG